MYNEKIEALIKAALIDGVLTEKEKQILFKRAESEGIDLDEFEMVLDARLVELEQEQKTSAPQSDKFGDVRKCPACGAIISSGIAVCKECGYAFTEASSTASREKLYELLDKIDQEHNKAGDLKRELGFVLSGGRTPKSTTLKVSAITNFSIPNTKADLLDFCSFLAVLANPSGPKDYKTLRFEEDLSYAYWLLYSACINKAKISFAKDPDFTPFFEKYEDFLIKSKKFKLPKEAYALIGLVAVFLIMGIIVLILT